ncbi:myrosinase 1-like isoform X2 [Odontomachus brunneus]|uniref:myrosinase 1-like isoform X2 n=1 Tax=Odontomachus brunneus TaxID=486640 RepID=UPI0013F287D3|nr:myrosinase 1-like isoform X2 [Odontomachus brunneus]
MLDSLFIFPTNKIKYLYFVLSLPNHLHAAQRYIRVRPNLLLWEEFPISIKQTNFMVYSDRGMSIMAIKSIRRCRLSICSHYALLAHAKVCCNMYNGNFHGRTYIAMEYIKFTAILILGIVPYMLRSSVEAQRISDKAVKDSSDNNVFPKDFLFGVSTSAPQYEGAWDANGRGLSVWDYMTHADSKLIEDESKMDVANDFYHKYKEDLRLARSIGTQMFKLSFSWTRILPSGFTNHISKEGVRFYKNVIDEILANGMIPMVTLFHWDLPNDMQKMGGLTNPLFVDWFEQYAKFVFSTFGNKVKFWTTIHEPNNLCYGGYSFEFIPRLNLPGIADYLCGHHAMLAHARVYHLYDREFRPIQNGKVGYSVNCEWALPNDSSSQEDVIAVEADYKWFISGFLNPIFSSDGDYLLIMKKRIANYSRVQGFARSRLPSFTKEQIRNVRGSADFLGINYYTYEIMKAEIINTSGITDVSYVHDVGANTSEENAPWVFAKAIQRLNEDYHPTIYITENGFPESGLEDKVKIAYLQGHLTEVLKAIQKGVDIRGYLLWSLLDNFQWQYGYKRKYGLFQVNFNDTRLVRTPRLSARYIAHVYKTRRLEDTLDI